jgi:5S rRNA maturation endonuclease (ribonuclease M5)
MNVIDLDKLENKIIQSDGGFIAMCPACSEDGRNLKSKNHLRVWASGKFSCVVNPSDKQHNARILQLVGTESTGEINYVAPEPKIETPKSWPLDTIKGLVNNHQYWHGRGISSETCDKFNIGLAFKGMMAGRSVIPIYSEQRDKIIGFTGRAIHKDNKIRWKHIGEKQNWVFYGGIEAIKKTGSIIITEGPADILALYECGIRNTLCLFGTTLSSKQLGFLIKSNPERIVIGLNNEPDNKNIGNEAASKLQKLLMNYFNPEKIIIGLSTTKDFNQDLMELGKKSIDEWAKKWLC